MTLLVIKALHIIGFTCWFAGLFYVVRLFIYNTEARDRNDAASEAMVAQFNGMQRRLWYGITWPALVVTVFFGGWMVVRMVSVYGTLAPWLHLKLGAVGLLVGYHLLLGHIHRRIVANRSTWSSRSLRILNEAATLFLVAIVFIAVLKDQLTLQVAAVVLGSFSLLLVVGFLVYQGVRRRR